jgi:hypothetical protein
VRHGGVTGMHRTRAQGALSAHAIWGGAVALTARLSLLGGFRLEVDGQPQPIRRMFYAK